MNALTLQFIAHGPISRPELEVLTRQTQEQVVDDICNLIGLVVVDDHDRWAITDAGRKTLDLLYSFDAQTARARDAACRGVRA